MENNSVIQGKRWGGLPWAEELREIMLVGAGGIGSWLALSLTRICHTVCIVDGDTIERVNVEGGQLYKTEDISTYKVHALHRICREFGCTQGIDTISEMYSEECGMYDICIAGLDNMKGRKEVFESWEKNMNIRLAEADGTTREEFLFIDGRMIGELFEVFVIQGNHQEQIAEYTEKWLFDDSEVAEADCTTKQTTFVAMGIASMITGLLCNWLANRKLGDDYRAVSFHTRLHVPSMFFETREVELINSEI